MKNKFLHSDFGLYFWIHFILILLAYSSWFLFSWWLVVLGSIVLWIQYWIFEGCILTKLHLGKAEGEFAFVAYYFEKINLRFDRKKLTFFIRHIVPFAFIFLAISWQLILKNNPLIF